MYKDKKIRRARLLSGMLSLRRTEEAPGEGAEASGPQAPLEIDSSGNIVGEQASTEQRSGAEAEPGSGSAGDREDRGGGMIEEAEERAPDRGVRAGKATEAAREGHDREDSAARRSHGSDGDPERPQRPSRSKRAHAAAGGKGKIKLDEKTRIPPGFDELKNALELAAGFNQSFDVVFREMVFGGQLTGIFYYNGFAKDAVLTEVLARLSYADQTKRQTEDGRSASEERDRPGERRGRGREGEGSEGKDNTRGHEPENAGRNAQEEGGAREAGKAEAGKAAHKAASEGERLDLIRLFDEALIPHIQVKKTDKLKEAIDNVAMGATAFFFEGQTEAVLVDAKAFPVRSTEEPDLERVVRGARDGFVETLLTNVTLVRRRIRDPKLKLEIMQVGTRTQTDVCIGYVGDLCDPRLVEAVRDKIKEVRVDGLPLAEKQLEEAIVSKRWNPYPMVRYSERPDVVAAHLLEGHLIVFVDTSPSVMILPTTFFHHVQHAEEYRQTPAVGTYLRWVRFIGIVSSIFLLPLWFLIVTSPELKPPGLEFIGPQKAGKIPLLGQFLIAELGIDLMRMAAVHTPTPLATAMGLVAAILIGDVAVKTGLFVNEVILYLAAAAIGTFATPSYELSLANRLARLGLLVAAAVFKVPGLILGSTALLVFLALQRSYNSPYLWPFIPFNGKALLDIMMRRPFLSMQTRLSLTKSPDRTRQPQKS